MKSKAIETAALKLSPKEKAELSYKLLESLQNDETESIDKIWAEEAERRYDSILKNEVHLSESKSVFKEAISKYKYVPPPFGLLILIEAYT